MSYSPTETYTPPVGRLPVLGKMRAEIDKLRADILVARSSVQDKRILTDATLKKEGAAIGKLIQEIALVREEAQKSNADAAAAIANVSLVSATASKTVMEKELARYGITKLVHEIGQIRASANKLMIDAVKTKADAELTTVAAMKTITELPKARVDIECTRQEASRLYAETNKINIEAMRTEREAHGTALKTMAEVYLLKQKTATEAAQTNDYIDPRIGCFTTGAVSGLMARQKGLFEKQASSFDRDAEQKLAKIMVDTWTVRQTTDGGQAVDVNGLADANIAAVVNKAKTGIGL